MLKCKIICTLICKVNLDLTIKQEDYYVAHVTIYYKLLAAAMVLYCWESKLMQNFVKSELSPFGARTSSFRGGRKTDILIRDTAHEPYNTLQRSVTYLYISS